MKIVCESCGAKYSIADDRVTGKVFKIRCKRCSEVIIVRGDPSKNISDTQNVEMVFIDGKKMDTSFHADYKNPIPRPIEDRPES